MSVYNASATCASVTIEFIPLATSFNHSSVVRCSSLRARYSIEYIFFALEEVKLQKWNVKNSYSTSKFCIIFFSLFSPAKNLSHSVRFWVNEKHWKMAKTKIKMIKMLFRRRLLCLFICLWRTHSNVADDFSFFFSSVIPFSLLLFPFSVYFACLFDAWITLFTTSIHSFIFCSFWDDGNDSSRRAQKEKELNGNLYCFRLKSGAKIAIWCHLRADFDWSKRMKILFVDSYDIMLCRFVSSVGCEHWNLHC